MSIELGRIGIWRHPSGLSPELAAEVEALGYGAIWVGRYLIFNRYMFGEATHKRPVAGQEPALELAAGLTSPAPAPARVQPAPPPAGRSAR